MKFGKSISVQQEGNLHLHYIEYKHLKKRIKDIAAQLEDNNFAEALTANTTFETDLAAEIQQVNACFAKCQAALLDKTGRLTEELQQRSDITDDGMLEQCVPCNAGIGSGTALEAKDSFRRLVDILREVDLLRKFAVWNAVAVVKILKKRRKRTSFGLEDVASERTGWLSRQCFFSGSDFAELHAVIESLGHMLVLSHLSLSPTEGVAPRSKFQREPQKCPICLDTISDMVELSCKHCFCWKCFVLGPIAFQPGEYRISQCPICRRETSPEIESSEGTAKSKGFLSRFLRTYFPQDEGDDVLDKADEEEDMREIVGVLVKAIMVDYPVESVQPAVAQDPGIASAASTAVPGGGDFFQTLPQKPLQDKRLMGAAQKLQWLQRDPLAIDGNMTCSLCSEPLLMEAVVSTPCKHYFHHVCISRIDLPQCPLCQKQLPFSWFLPKDHPCLEHGFRVIPHHAYKPLFAGGPSRGSCGYPLHQPPPKSLYGSRGLVMKSYLHCVEPTGDGYDPNDLKTPPSSYPTSPHISPAKCTSEDSESSSEESNSEDGGEDGRDRFAKHGRVRKFAYSALGKMRLCEPLDTALPLGLASCTQSTIDAVMDPAATSAIASAPIVSPCFTDAGGNVHQDSWSAEPVQGNPKVLLIENHL